MFSMVIVQVANIYQIKVWKSKTCCENGQLGQEMQHLLDERGQEYLAEDN